MEDGLEEIEFLVRSRTRVRILEELSEEDLTKDELRRRLDGSRTTIQRNLDALADRGLIEDMHPTYSLATRGEYLVADLLDYAEKAETVARLQPFLEWVPKDALGFDIRHLKDATLYTPSEGNPYAMLNNHVNRIDNADSGWGLLPFTGLHATKTAHERVVEHGATFELVVEPDVAETFQSSPRYRELTEEMAETGRFEVLVYDGSMPFSLNLLDEFVQIVVADGEEPRATVESDAAAVSDWAEKTYEAYRDQSRRIDLAD
jgi:predicted transcriptional regulator